MELNPYNANLLRCHPIWYQLTDNDKKISSTATLSSKKKLHWICSECNIHYTAIVNNMKVGCGRCSLHQRKTHSATRRRYRGNISSDVSLYVRAALLREHKKEDIVKTILDIKLVQNSFDAHNCVAEIMAYDIVDLLDNGFWWFDSFTRKCGDRFKRTKKIDGILTKRQRILQSETPAEATEKDEFLDFTVYEHYNKLTSRVGTVYFAMKDYA